MSITVSKAKKFITNQSNVKSSIDILNEINENIFSYSSVAEVSPYTVEFKYYKEPIAINFNINNKRNTDSKNKREKNNISKEDKEQNKERTNRYRNNTIHKLIKSNPDLNSFLTLTLGDKDFKELIINTIKNNKDIDPNLYFNNLDKDLNALKGIKNILDYSFKSKEKLNSKQQRLRHSVINYLGLATGKEKKIIEKLKEKHKNISKKRFNQEVKREVCRQLNDLIFNGNSSSIDDANNQFRFFVERINRYLSSKEYGVNKFEYIRVMEMQKNGRIHFHLLCNLPFIDQWNLQKIWSNGIIHIQKVDNLYFKKKGIFITSKDSYSDKIRKISLYFAKELEITSSNPIACGRQIFTTSQGIRRPLKITSIYLLDIIRNYLKNINPIREYECNNEEEYKRDFKLKEYNLSKDLLYNKIHNIISKYIQEMIDITEANNKKIIDQEVFLEVIKNSPFKKDFI